MARVLFWGILIFFCARVVIPQWSALRVSQHLQTLAPEWLLACGVTLLGHSLYLFALWGALLRLFGATPRARPLFRAYALSLLPKYVPGKVLAYGVRARLALDAGVEGSAVSASLVWEALFVLGSAVFLGGVGLLLPGPAFGREPVTWLVIGFVIAAVVFGLAGSTRVLGSKWKEWVGIPQVMARPGAAAALLGLYASTWLTYALAHWFLILAVAPGRVVPLASLTIAVAVSWGVGFVSVIAPGGLGVREGALYVFLSAWLSASEALLLVTLSRAASLVVEAALAGAWGAMALTSARRGAAGT